MTLFCVAGKDQGHARPVALTGSSEDYITVCNIIGVPRDSLLFQAQIDDAGRFAPLRKLNPACDPDLRMFALVCVQSQIPPWDSGQLYQPRRAKLFLESPCIHTRTVIPHPATRLLCELVQENHRVLLRGRRRIGKTTAVLEFCRQQFAQGRTVLHITCIAHWNEECAAQLARIFNAFDGDIRPPQSLAELARCLAWLVSNGVTVCLDEAQELLSSDFFAILKEALDGTSEASHAPLILYGSYIKHVRQLLSGNQPLFGRGFCDVAILPPPFSMITEFLKANNVTGNQAAMLLCSFGGVLSFYHTLKAPLESVTEHEVWEFLRKLTLDEYWPVLTILKAAGGKKALKQARVAAIRSECKFQGLEGMEFAAMLAAMIDAGYVERLECSDDNDILRVIDFPTLVSRMIRNKDKATACQQIRTTLGLNWELASTAMIAAWLKQALPDIKVHHSIWGYEPFTEIDKIITCPSKKLLFTASDKLDGKKQREGLLHLLAHWISWHNNRMWKHEGLNFKYFFLACSPTVPVDLGPVAVELHKILSLTEHTEVENFCARTLSGYVNSGNQVFQLHADAPLPLCNVFALQSVIAVDLESMCSGAFLAGLGIEAPPGSDPYQDWAAACQDLDRNVHLAYIGVTPSPIEEKHDEEIEDIPDFMFRIGE
eukprot:TRINITY_DN11089_c1_g2_i1.p1 TRINITY_DN11089_c1_g2~~TRINITY_DN11089_c1_g2_i1.p1  ORF type:complete len:657 (+),score=81.79 TRINITY_DN11089_c1_g2_i1:173-2143(+)